MITSQGHIVSGPHYLMLIKCCLPNTAGGHNWVINTSSYLANQNLIATCSHFWNCKCSWTHFRIGFCENHICISILFWLHLIFIFYSSSQGGTPEADLLVIHSVCPIICHLIKIIIPYQTLGIKYWPCYCKLNNSQIGITKPDMAWQRSKCSFLAAPKGPEWTGLLEQPLPSWC